MSNTPYTPMYNWGTPAVQSAGGFNLNFGMPQVDPSVGWAPGQVPTGVGASGFNQNVMQQAVVDNSKSLIPEGPGKLNNGASGSGGNNTSDWNTGQWLQLGTNMFGAYTGYRQLQNAEDMLDENKRQFNMNWEAQRGLTNAQLEARRQRQIAAQGVASGNGMSAQEYVAKYGVK